MLNLSKIQLELERAKEKLRNVEEIIQKVEGKTFPNGPVRYGKNELHSDKPRSPAVPEDGKNQRKRVISSVIDSRVQKLPSDEMTFSLKRGLREKRESNKSLKRPIGDIRPQGVFSRLSGLPFQQTDDDDDEEEFTKKPSIQSRVITTVTEVPSRQEVIAAQAVDEQSKQRNKRMFGALVGTLQKFRKEETRVREREEKKLKVEKKLEEDARREKEKLMQEKRELFMEKKRREVEIKRIEWSLNRVKEYEAWEANVLPLKNFIQTQAKPHIFYLPGVHNAKTADRLALTQKIVDKMIEKRKTNLKDEIENSEKKARKTAAEEAEEDEAENIPEDHDHGHEDNNTEQQIQGDFEVKNNGNGFIVEERGEGENQTKIERDMEEIQDTIVKKEKWDNAEEAEDKETQEECVEYESERENDEMRGNLEDSKENVQLTENENKSSNVTTEEVPGDVEMSDETVVGEDQSQLKSECNFSQSEERIVEDQESKTNEVINESNLSHIDNPNMESTEADTSFKAPIKESENAEEETVNENSEDGEEKAVSTSAVSTLAVSTSADLNEKIVDQDSEVSSTVKNEPTCESEPKTGDSLKKTTEKKEKSGEGSRRREKSRSRKPHRRSRSPRRRRSGSPRYSSRSNHRRSGSYRKRSIRKRSRSYSPAKKFRRSRSPISRRGEKSAFASRRRSPPAKSRRRNSSRSSSSASPRKRRSRSHSSTSSKSN